MTVFFMIQIVFIYSYITLVNVNIISILNNVIPIFILIAVSVFVTVLLFYFKEIKKSNRLVIKYKLEKQVAEIRLRRKEKELNFIKSRRGRHMPQFFDSKENKQKIMNSHEQMMSKDRQDDTINLLPYHNIISNQLRPIYPNFSDTEINHCVFMYLGIPEDKTAKTLHMPIAEVTTMRCKVRSKILKNKSRLNLKSHLKSLMMN